MAVVLRVGLVDVASSAVLIDGNNSFVKAEGLVSAGINPAG